MGEQLAQQGGTGDALAETRAGAGALRIGAGVRRLEADLLQTLEACVEAPADLQRLADPVRVVVPSRSLRVHVAAAIARARGRAAVGLQIQTLGGLALDVLARADIASDPALLFPTWVRRAARDEPALFDGLDGRVDGYGAVVAAVDDLLDAGFEPVHADALQEHLLAQPIGQDRVSRARAVVRVAAKLAAALGRDGVGHRSQAMVAAREAIERDPSRLPHRGLLLYGFADATGVQADLLAVLVRRAGATAWIDAPVDPSASPPRRAGLRFGAAFRERFPELAGLESRVPASAPIGRIVRVEAPTPGAEVRDVALRLRAAIDGGAPPERLAVVARDLGPYRTALRVQLLRLGIPFSGASEHGAATAARRRLDALLSLLAPDEPPAMETWLVAHAGLGRDAVERARLRRTCHERGALRLDDVERLEGSPAARGARALHAALSSRPALAPLSRHVDWLAALVRDALRWRSETPGDAELQHALAQLPGAAAVDGDEFLSLLGSLLAHAGRVPLGGAGGGVQVLSVMEARARSFDQLFVLGLQRGAFPRAIHEDPLLPDGVRARLREVLPDLPIKRDGFDEERFLFAQLLSAADAVTLCVSETGAEGRRQPRSPLLESLDRAGVAAAHERAAPLHALAPSAPLPAAERALLAGLHEARGAFAQQLSHALEDAAGVTRSVAAQRAKSRLAVLDEMDPRDARRHALGPYFGFVGARGALPGDRRDGPVFVTRLEDMARCPWRSFLTRVLRLAPVADAAAELPSATDARLLGNVVHAVLDRIAHRPAEGPQDWAREGVRMDWPDAASLARHALACAEEELRDAAVPIPGYARVLARRALPYLERARESDWADGAPAVVATEARGAAQGVDADGRMREIHFKADRIDRAPDGSLVFTDYKTGKPLAMQKTPKARDNAVVKQVAAGRALQGLLYARAGGPGAVGRYLFLTESAPEGGRALETPDASPLRDAWDASTRVLLGVWDQGSFLPRLRRADRDEEAGVCRTCEVRDACIRGDSGARRRLERWSEREAGRTTPAEAAADAVYRLGVEP